MLGDIVGIAFFVIPVALVSTLVLRLIYLPLVGRDETLFAPITSTVALIIFAGWYGIWTDAQDSHSEAGHSMIWAFFVMPITLGWIGNLVWDVARLRRKQKDQR